MGSSSSVSAVLLIDTSKNKVLEAWVKPYSDDDVRLLQEHRAENPICSHLAALGYTNTYSVELKVGFDVIQLRLHSNDCIDINDVKTTVNNSINYMIKEFN